MAELAPKPDVPSTIRRLPGPAAPVARLRPDGVGPPHLEAPPPAPTEGPAPPPKLEPLSPERYKVSFTASSALREKLERLQALMEEDLAAVIEAAVTEKLERLQAKRYAETKRSRKNVEADRYVTEVALHPSSRQTGSTQERRRSMRIRRRDRSALHGAARTRVSPPRTLRPRRYTRPGDDQPAVSDPQPVRGRAGLRTRRDGQVSAPRGPRLRASTRLRASCVIMLKN